MTLGKQWGDLQNALSANDERDVLIRVISDGYLASCFSASRSNAGNHNQFCNGNLLLQRVQSRESVIVCANIFER